MNSIQNDVGKQHFRLLKTRFHSVAYRCCLASNLYKRYSVDGDIAVLTRCRQRNGVYIQMENENKYNIRIVKVATTAQRADFLTKGLPDAMSAAEWSRSFQLICKTISFEQQYP
jgi:hypothetical protein